MIAAVLNAALLYLLNVAPGWQALSFLTKDTPHVLALVNFSLLAGVVVNAMYLACDPPWLKSLGDLVTTGIGLAVLIRLWQIFPFDFSGTSFNWTLLVRVVLVVAAVGAVIGMVTQVVSLLRSARRRRS
ncbi:MAG: hypothetical protein ACRDRV_11535 [Pseudonocardiaceae bacterium]